MDYFLGVDVGGTKTHALLADSSGKALSFSHAGAGSWEIVGYDGLTQVVETVTRQVLQKAKIDIQQITKAAFGVAGYDWPSQRAAHLDAFRNLGLLTPPLLVNDTLLGIAAGSDEGWGISIVSGTGCNCRGISRDRSREGRVIGGAPLWSGEAAGGPDIILRALRSIAYEWNMRGPHTSLSDSFLGRTGARNLNEFIEGIYVGQFPFDPDLVFNVFSCAHQGDQEALEIMRWAGRELAGMITGVANQLELKDESFDVVLVGSIFDGHPLIAETLRSCVIHKHSGARFIRSDLPPVVGAVLLAMGAEDGKYSAFRNKLIASTSPLFLDS